MNYEKTKWRLSGIAGAKAASTNLQNYSRRTRVQLVSRQVSNLKDGPSVNEEVVRRRASKPTIAWQIIKNKKKGCRKCLLGNTFDTHLRPGLQSGGPSSSWPQQTTPRPASAPRTSPSQSRRLPRLAESETRTQRNIVKATHTPTCFIGSDIWHWGLLHRFVKYCIYSRVDVFLYFKKETDGYFHGFIV